MFRPNPDFIYALLKAGADPNARDEYGKSPLHWAAYNTQTKNPEVITALLAARADPKARTAANKTPLHLAAATKENPEVITQEV